MFTTKKLLFSNEKNSNKNLFFSDQKILQQKYILFRPKIVAAKIYSFRTKNLSNKKSFARRRQHNMQHMQITRVKEKPVNSRNRPPPPN